MIISAASAADTSDCPPTHTLHTATLVTQTRRRPDTQRRDAQQHMGKHGARRGRGVGTDLALDSKALDDARLLHVADGAVVHVQACGALALVVRRPELRHELRAVVPAVLRDRLRQRPQRLRKRLPTPRQKTPISTTSALVLECPTTPHPTARAGRDLDGERLLARRGLGELVDGLGHEHLAAAAAIDGARVLDHRLEHAQRVVDRPLRLVQQVHARSPQHDRARLAPAPSRPRVSSTLAPQHCAPCAAEACALPRAPCCCCVRHEDSMVD
eukprot:485693-Rhodomonas_salina.1